jgi:hypothetical protein
MKLAKEHNDEVYLIAPAMLAYHILWGESRDIKANIRAFKKTFLGGNFFVEGNVAGAVQNQEGGDRAGEGQASRA